MSTTQPTPASIASAIQSGLANKVLLNASGTVSVTYNAANKYIWLAHQSNYTTKTKWYNTALNNGNIGTGELIASPVTQGISSHDGYWSNVQYKLYISNYATSTDGAIEFRNT